MFNTLWGKYRWLRLPFGLKIASDVFQERLDRVLRLLEGVHGIADDILTHGETKIQHDGRLLTLLETVRMNNLSLSPDKIQFKSTDCKFFGHRLTPEGLKLDPEKVKAIVQMPPPQSIQSLQSSNGMVNYLKRFSPVLTELAEPLRRLQKWDTIWAWESEQQQAFKKIKTTLTTLPVLTYFDKDKDHIIQTDASKTGISAVLLQEGQPIVYAFRALSKTEKRYSNIERELLGVVFGLERLHHYTFGSSITVETDHQPLTSIWKKTSKFKSKTAETVTQTGTIWYAHRVPQRQRKCHSRCSKPCRAISPRVSRLYNQSEQCWEDPSTPNNSNSSSKKWEIRWIMWGHSQRPSTTTIGQSSAWRVAPTFRDCPHSLQ